MTSPSRGALALLALAGCTQILGLDQDYALGGAAGSGGGASGGSGGAGAVGGTGGTGDTGGLGGVGGQPLAAVAELIGKGFHACLRLEDGALWCWGSNRNGKLGEPESDSDACPGTAGPVACRWQAIRVENLPPVAGAATGTVSTCAWDDGGQVYCWGTATYGLLGSPEADFPVCLDGSTHCSESPVQVPLVGVTGAAVGAVHTCAIASGSVWCWGANGHGWLGTGDMNPYDGPTAVEVVTSGISRLAIDAFADPHTCAVRDTDHTVFCWGRNQGGELGHEPNGNDPACSGNIWCNPLPSQARSAQNVPLSPVSDVATMEIATCAVTTGGELHCWGAPTFATTTLGTPTPNPVDAMVMGQMKQVAGTHRHACAIDAAGDLYCWGRNNLGQLGLGHTQGEPIAAGGAGGAGGGGAGGSGGGPTEFVCGFGADLVGCWLTPQKVELPGPAKTIVALSDTTLVLLEDGRIFGFGQAGRGLIGIDPSTLGLCAGTVESSCVPTPTEVQVLPR